MSPKSQIDPETSDRLARRALFSFVLTFIVSRAVIFLIMSHRIPNLFLVLLTAVIGFGVAVFAAGNYIGHLMGPTLHDLELSSTP